MSLFENDNIVEQVDAVKKAVEECEGLEQVEHIIQLLNNITLELGYEIEDIEFLDDTHYEHLHRFDVGGQEWAIGTDEEADAAAGVYIKDSLWAFNASFIACEVGKPELEEMIKMAQEAKCEGANEAIEALIDDMDSFIEAAISADGRAHFLNTYDGNEFETSVNGVDYYFYRIN